jgi:peptidylprolyl isomerase
MTRSNLQFVALMSVIPLAALNAAKAAQPIPTKATTPSKPTTPSMITTATGLKYVDTRVGTGVASVRGRTCLVHYTGWLNNGRGGHGRKFDSSLDRREPLAFPVGVGRVIKGWDEGLMGMKVGGKRTLYIPSYLGYGPQGAGGDIPPNADLIFDVELVGVQ